MRLRELFKSVGDISRPLTEMPELTGPTQFGLNQDDVNRATLKNILKQPHVVLEETNDYKLIRTGTTEGAIVLYSPSSEVIGYYIRYETEHTPLVGHSVTQVALWRKFGFAANIGATRRIFFDYLLKEWPAITSDRIQTLAGEGFWRDRMAEALSKGLRIGMADFEENRMVWFEGSTDDELGKWIDGFDAWKWDISAQDMRFVISQ